MRSFVIVPVIVSSLVGCASMPDVTVQYRFPKAATNIVVTQTFACSNDSTQVISAINVAAATAYSSNRDIPDTGSIEYGKYGSLLEDADVGPTFTSDGRLLGINSSTTGEALATIKAAVSLATAVAGFAALEAKHDGNNNPIPLFGPSDIATTCEAIKNFAQSKGGGSTPVVTLTYSINILYDQNGAPAIAVDPKFNPNGYDTTPHRSINLKVDLGDDAIVAGMRVAIFPIYLTVVSASPDPHASLSGHSQWSDNDSAPSGFELIKLNAVTNYVLRVYGPDGNFANSIPIWEGEVAAPIRSYYPLAVPSGVLFGKQGLTLSLSDPGSVTKLEYSANTGASDALTSAGSIAGALPTTTSQATALQSQSDLIYQQQRLVICKATPKDCPSK